MRKSFVNYFSILPILLIVIGCQENSSNNYNPPITDSIDFGDTINGKYVPNPYGWLENTSEDSVKLWIINQDSLTKKYFKELTGLNESLEARMDQLSKEINIDAPIITNSGQLFYIGNNYSLQQPVLKFKESQLAQEVILLDPNQMSKEGKYSISNFVPSPNGKYLAYSISDGTSRYQDWNIMEVNTRKILDDNIEAASLNILSWMPDESGFIFRTYNYHDRENEDITPHTYLIKQHLVGSRNVDDVTLFTAQSENDYLDGYLSRDGNVLIVTTGYNSNDVYFRDLISRKEIESPLKGLIDNIEYSFIGNDKEKYWFVTNENAENKKIIELSLNLNTFKWSSPKVIIDQSSHNINQAFLFGDHFVLHTFEKAKPFLKVFTLNGSLIDTVELPVGLMWNSFTPVFQQGLTGNRYQDAIFVRSQAITSSNSVYKYDIKSGRFDFYHKTITDFDFSNFETTRVFCKGDDGAEIPMFLTHKKGLNLDGTNPTLMCVYGAWGFTDLPFIGRKYAIFLEQGGIHAMPNIRGGGALGTKWYEAGRGKNKINGINDAIAAAEWLIKNGYTNSDKLIIEGNSAGGVVASAAVNKRPDLFKVAWFEFPVFDMPRAPKFRGGGGWKSQFGDPENIEELNALVAISPYHNIQPGKEYPHTLIAVGENDHIAAAHHSFKMIASLQNTVKSPSLMWLNWGGGHGGRNEEERAKLRVAELTFAFDAIDHEYKD